jgi:hypothetical protein
MSELFLCLHMVDVENDGGSNNNFLNLMICPSLVIECVL